MRMRITQLVCRLVEKIRLECPIYAPSGAEANPPEQHATWPIESNFDLTIAVSGSNESPNYTLHDSYAQD
jgi:hypothetical protein